MAARVSLAELGAAGFVLHSAEAAAIVVDVCRQFDRGAIRGIPSTHVIRLTPDGAVVAEGPITTDQPPVAKAAQLLNDLLPPFDALPAYRVPGGLRLVVARALRTLDLPPFASLDDFSAAVLRFAADDLASTARNLYRAWELTKAPRALSISDLRRARRATGLSLEDIASVCSVEASLLRELEWGYLKNWRNDSVGLGWLSGYAKASGLDEQLVTSIVVPMFDEAQPPHTEEVGLVAAGPQTIVPAGQTRQHRGRRWGPIVWAAASAAAIALVSILTMVAWPRPAVKASLETPVPAFVPAPVLAPVADAVPAVQTRPVARGHVAKARTTVKRAASQVHKPTSKPNFFKRQLLRIVIK
jgi:hypothetical protein